MDKEVSRLAIPVFRSRVAPVLNWCSKIHIFSKDAADSISGQEIILLNMNAFDRLKILWEEGVRTLICGALSPDLLLYGESLGFEIIHGVAGEIEEVLLAFQAFQLHQPRFRLPGCRGRRQYRGGSMCVESKLDPPGDDVHPKMPAGKGHKGSTTENGGAAPVPKKSTGTAPKKAGPGGYCVCPQCGRKVPHERGIPCAQIPCPQCDLPMVRR